MFVCFRYPSNKDFWIEVMSRVMILYFLEICPTYSFSCYQVLVHRSNTYSSVYMTCLLLNQDILPRTRFWKRRKVFVPYKIMHREDSNIVLQSRRIPGVLLYQVKSQGLQNISELISCKIGMEPPTVQAMHQFCSFCKGVKVFYLTVKDRIQISE